MSDPITITIPLELPSQNATGTGRTWRARAAKIARLRAAWHMAAMVGMRKAGVVEAAGPRALQIIAYRKQRCADIANLIGGAKAPIDGLVDAGLLLDDRDTKARITYEQHVRSAHPNKQACTVLVVTDLYERTA